MRVVLDSKKQELAVLVPIGDYIQSPSLFFSQPGESLQVGSLRFPVGGSAQAHIHKGRNPGGVYPVVELIIVLRGVAKADIFDETKTLVETLTIRVGDMLLLKRGGHGFRFAVETQLLDVRPGPYVDREADKDVFG